MAEQRNRYETGATYVPALRDPEPRRPVYLDPTDLVTLPPAAMVQTEIHTSAVDRAKGFQVATVPISIAFGVGALVVAAVGWSVPALSMAGLWVFWVAFLAWWILGWLIHNTVSPDGLALVHTLLGWRYLYLEANDRRKRYRDHK